MPEFNTAISGHFNGFVPTDHDLTQIQTGKPVNKVVYKIVTDADPQFHYTNRVTPIQSRAFDTGISVAIRPQALTLGTNIILRHTDRIIEKSFSGYERFNLGDVLDTSNLAEHVMYMLGNFSAAEVRLVLGLPENEVEWTQAEWEGYFAHTDLLTWQFYYDRIISLMAEGKLGDTPMRPGGNHDGALVGNGIERSFSEKELHKQMRSFEKKMQQAERELEAVRAGKKKNLYVLQTKDDKIRELEARIYAYEKKIEEINIQLKNVSDHNGDMKRAFGDKQFLIPRSLIRVAFGLGKFDRLHDEDGYWAQNAGGAEYIVDKEKYLACYLEEQFPHVEIIVPDEESGHASHHGHHDEKEGSVAHFHNGNGEHSHPSIEPFAARLDYADIDFDLFKDDFEVAHTPFDSAKGSFVKDAGGAYQRKIEVLGAQSSVHEKFSALWKEVRPGEWTCLVDLPFAPDANATQHFILLQAKEGPEVNGRKTFHFLLDNMDNTMEEIQIAFFGGMSRLQRQLLELFEMEMRNQYNGQTLFLHSSHFPLSRVSKAYWKQFGWEDYFSQPDIVPFVLAGHEHDRGLVDENKKHFFGFEACFGKQTTSREGGFHSFVAPSTTDDPNEFMSTDIEFDEKTGKYTAVQRFHKVIPEDAIAQIRRQDAKFMQDNPDALSIAKALEDLAPTIAHRRYHEYAIDGNFLRAVRNLFVSPEHIVAYDAIPISIGQFRETILYTEYTLRFLREEFGDEDELVKMYESTLHKLKDHFERFMNGDPFAEDYADRIGWNEGLVRAKKMHKRDGDQFLASFNDVFDTPAYDYLQILQGMIPEDSRAYNFWLVFARQAADNEKNDDGVIFGVGGLSDLPDETRIDFNLKSTKAKSTFHEDLFRNYSEILKSQTDN